MRRAVLLYELISSSSKELSLLKDNMAEDISQLINFQL